MSNSVHVIVTRHVRNKHFTRVTPYVNLNRPPNCTASPSIPPERTTQMPAEKGAPPQVDVKSLNDYLEVMSKAVFQSGMSWRVVNAKWPDTNEAFHGFEIGRVASLSDEELEELAHDTRVIRNRRKLAAIVHNAQRIIELDAEHGDFRNYLRSRGDFYDIVKDLKKQFKFLGDTGSYFFLYVIGENVPPHDEWMRVKEQSVRRR